MATVLRNVSPDVQHLADAVNSLKKQIGAGSDFHLDAYETPVALADATNLATAVALANQCKAVYNAHVGDVLAHKAADGTAEANDAANPNAGDGGLAAAITLVNDIKAKYNTHRASTTFHYSADSTNTIVTADATDLASLETLVNDVKAKLNAHMASAPSAPSLRVVDG